MEEDYMSKGNKMLVRVFLAILIAISIPIINYANSAEPPSILIIVPNAPDDLEISIGFEETFTKARKIDKVIEKYYTFYSREIQRVPEYTFNISTENINYEITLDKPPQSYNNIYTLDFHAQTLTLGKSLSRSILLVSLRIILTLIIEGVVLWKFSFREKRTWIAFFVINLITQGSLNLWINGFSPIMSYLIIALIFAEIIIIVVEVFLFLTFLKEHSKFITISYVFVANILSLIVGGYIITMLPI